MKRHVAARLAASTRQPLDFACVSLVGTLKETPWPDILEELRCILGSQDGTEVKRRVSSGRSDKTRQVYFEVDEGLNPADQRPYWQRTPPNPP